MRKTQPAVLGKDNDLPMLDNCPFSCPVQWIAGIIYAGKKLGKNVLILVHNIEYSPLFQGNEGVVILMCHHTHNQEQREMNECMIIFSHLSGLQSGERVTYLKAVYYHIN